jgi:hypothetical protein
MSVYSGMSVVLSSTRTGLSLPAKWKISFPWVPDLRNSATVALRVSMRYFSISRILALPGMPLGREAMVAMSVWLFIIPYSPVVKANLDSGIKVSDVPGVRQESMDSHSDNLVSFHSDGESSFFWERKPQDVVVRVG